MAWVEAGIAAALATGTATVVEVNGRRIALCATEEGFYAIDDVCTHDGASLDQGQLDGCEIECPRHGARFDVRTGKVRALPAVRPVKTHPTRVTDGVVEIDAS